MNAKSAPVRRPPLPAEARLERIPEFAGAVFEKSVVDREGLPFITGPEIAFAGRSNAGKSSSINKLAGQTKLAYASKMPGRTRELNFFRFGPAATWWICRGTVLRAHRATSSASGPE